MVGAWGHGRPQRLVDGHALVSCGHLAICPGEGEQVATEGGQMAKQMTKGWSSNTWLYK